MSNVHMTETVRHDIRVKVETAYIEEQSDPEQNRYVFAYSITITNIGTVTAQLLRRHWSITDANNRVQEVHGEGVVGEQPVLRPGEHYHYTSGAVLETRFGYMQGIYDMMGDDGVEFTAIIPIFSLSIPHSLH